jgi:hypothetical protein
VSAQRHNLLIDATVCEAEGATKAGNGCIEIAIAFPAARSGYGAEQSGRERVMSMKAHPAD